MHVGIRGPLYSRDDLKNDESFGFKIIHCDEFQSQGTDKIAERIRNRVGNNPLYLSIDIDVLDPAFAPGTGTPEIAGMTTREMVNVLRGLSGLNLRMSFLQCQCQQRFSDCSKGRWQPFHALEK